ncbi:LPS assembly lipoprotein LptE [Vibrio hippocampi]|uniref:LPS-assembly lipoprotein LptE n=1 Tax=Vibrio hippocampi TaxID=654686 RepID=A0ABN8DEW4_9VIBR|nr:LPS assembly lipoprotein LptE [Vibrio hippocampi]CAH0525086.1 LPS-assembly lipoprotein LptE [Vibrio hippocampi]
MRQMKMNFVKTTIIAVLATMLTACGFHLRGEYTVPEDIKQISVTSYDQYSTITRLVKEQLRLSKIDIVPPSSDVPNLHIQEENVSDRTLSLYQNTSAAEKEITYMVKYQVTLPEIGSKQFEATMTRSYLDNPLSALAKTVERDLLENEMRAFSAQQMMRQMARLKTEIEEYEAEHPNTNDPNTNNSVTNSRVDPS